MNGSPFSAENIISALLPAGVPKSFEELPIPLLVVATDFYAQSQYVMDKGPLIPAIAASCALPSIFRPVQLDGRILIDGGFVNVVPFDLLGGRADQVAGIDVTAGPQQKGDKIPSLIEVIIGSTQITMRSVVNEKLEHSKPDIFVRAELGQFGVLEFYKYVDIYAAAGDAKEEFKRKCEAVLAGG
jgi:NTE family protein